MELFNEYALRKAIGAAIDKDDPDAIIETVKAYNDAVKADNERRELERRGNLWIATCAMAMVSICAVVAYAFLK